MSPKVASTSFDRSPAIANRPRTCFRFSMGERAYGLRTYVCASILSFAAMQGQVLANSPWARTPTKDATSSVKSHRLQRHQTTPKVAMEPLV